MNEKTNPPEGPVRAPEPAPVAALLAAVREAGKRFHVVGIGGVGMSAVARLLLDHGFAVTGSDLQDNEITRALRGRGVPVHHGHAGAHVSGAGAVVASPAVPPHDEELAAARAAGIPVVSRATMLGGLVRSRRAVCVAGSHGKTTTTAMTAFLLREAGIDAGFAVGGFSPSLGGENARLGTTAPFVVETCEAFGALDAFRPDTVVITNVDDDHVDHYGNAASLQDAFVRLTDRRPEAGTAILCADDPGVLALLPRVRGPVLTYGLGEDATLRGYVLGSGPRGSRFRLRRDRRELGEADVPLPGLHNVRNALASLAAAIELGVDPGLAVRLLARFQGVRRRWERKGEANGIRVFEDFAHHPAEVAATLSVARQACGAGGRLIVAFEPQLHSRTAIYGDRFAEVLRAADGVFVAPVASAGERDDGSRRSERIAGSLSAHGTCAVACRDLDDLARRAAAHLRSGDLLVALGGASVGAAAERVLELLRSASARRDSSQRPARQPIRWRLLQQAFEESADRAPEATCLIDGSSSWTFGQLESDSNRVARYLSRGGLAPDEVVVVSMEKSIRLLAVILGVLKAGGAYLPVDPRMARVRLVGVLGRARVRTVLTDSRSVASLGVPRENVLCVDEAWPEIQREPDGRPPVASGPEHLAYAGLTSGSTGAPKLIGIEHRNIANLLDYATRELLDPDDLSVVPFIDSIGFDSSVQQLFATFAHGGALLLDADLARPAPAGPGITSVGTTPSLLASWLDAGALPASVRVIGLGGEVIPPSLVERLQALPHVRKVLNYYGPSETTVYSTVAWLVDPRRPEPTSGGETPERVGRIVGHPIQETRVYLLDDAQRTVPDGDEGEIVIAGAGVGRGYLGDAGENEGRFGTDLLSAEAGARWYRTGDRGRLLPGGAIEFLGRLDGQLKIRGVRLEPEEIEAHVVRCPGVREAAAYQRDLEPGGTRLLVALVADSRIDLRRLRSFLEGRVPAVMLPDGIVRVESLPLTPHGKLDRRALPGLGEPELLARPPHVPPRTELERRLAEIFEELLGVARVGVDDSFFELGGDSLQWIRLLAEIQRALGLEAPPDAGPELATVAAMAGRLEPGISRQPEEPPGPEQELDDILRRQRHHLVAWRGTRARPDALIVTHNASGRRPGLFWCFQGWEELSQLAANLGPDQPVHGMRSGQLVMQVTERNVKRLASRYAEEMRGLQPSGPFFLGGNCQGAGIARAIASSLREAGRAVARLFLMEQASFPPRDEPVALIFGRESHLNPYRKSPDPDAVFRVSYPAGYTLDLIPGSHGHFFEAPNVEGLASALTRRLRDANGDGRTVPLPP